MRCLMWLSCFFLWLLSRMTLFVDFRKQQSLALSCLSVWLSLCFGLCCLLVCIFMFTIVCEACVSLSLFSSRRGQPGGQPSPVATRRAWTSGGGARNFLRGNRKQVTWSSVSSVSLGAWKLHYQLHYRVFQPWLVHNTSNNCNPRNQHLRDNWDSDCQI